MFGSRLKLAVDKRLIFFLLFSLLLFLIIRGFLVVEKNFRSVIITLAEVRADILATEAINIAISETIARDILYKDLVFLQKDRDGRVVVAQVNTMEINRLIAQTTISVQNALQDLRGEAIYIPLGHGSR